MADYAMDVDFERNLDATWRKDGFGTVTKTFEADALNAAISGLNKEQHTDDHLVVRRKQIDERAKKAERIIDKLNSNSNRIVNAMGLDTQR
jgi:ABC-type uncharacterized transport system substrate-binding protein